MTLVWHWPQITWVVLVGLNIVFCIAKDGQPKDGNYSASTAILGALIGFGIMYYGGFFAGASP